MKIDEVVARPGSTWMNGSGPDSDVVLSTRIRLARNLRGVPFPHLLDTKMAAEVLDKVFTAARHASESSRIGNLSCFRMDQVKPLDRAVLVEKHLISPQHGKAPHGGLILSEDETISIMVNEEDHLRIQGLFSGMQLEPAWKTVDAVDDLLEQDLAYAFSAEEGYLTSCPTNVGTGMRASVMVHLPALSAINQVGQLAPVVAKFGLLVRGLYGEGTEALGDVYQISNQVTLGVSEQDIISKVLDVAKQVMLHERKAREYLMQEQRIQTEDKVGRSLGLLLYSSLLSSDEAIAHWSNLKLGIEMGMIKNVSRKQANQLLVATRVGYISRLSGRELIPAQRDHLRAETVKKILKSEQYGMGDKR